MNFEVHWVAMARYLESSTQPVFLLGRPTTHSAQRGRSALSRSEHARLGRHWALYTDILIPEPRWSLTESGDWVRVPLFAYQTSDLAYSALLGCGLEIGIRAMNSFLSSHPEPILKIVLALGDQCTQLDDKFRCYVGLAVQTQRR